MKLKAIALVLAMVMCPIVSADDTAEKKKKRGQRGRNNPTATLMRQFKDVELTDEQKSQIEAMVKKTMEEMSAMREKAGLTAELMKKRAAAQKELKDSDKKASELVAAINEKVGITEEQATALRKSNQLRAKMLHDAVGLLTDEQKAKLPERTQKMVKAASERKGKNAKKGKGSKKKKAAEEEKAAT